MQIKRIAPEAPKNMGHQLLIASLASTSHQPSGPKSLAIAGSVVLLEQYPRSITASAGHCGAARCVAAAWAAVSTTARLWPSVQSDDLAV